MHVTTLVQNWVDSIRALKSVFLPFCLLCYLLRAAWPWLMKLLRLLMMFMMNMWMFILWFFFLLFNFFNMTILVILLLYP